MLIFNEILELKFWGLNTNLSININVRQKIDYIDENGDTESSKKRDSRASIDSNNDEEDRISSRKSKNSQ